MQKRPTALLEILIALSLIILALAPLIRQPIQLQMAEKQRLLQIEANRIIAWTYSEIREKFLKGDFRWEQIPAFQEKSKVYELPLAPLSIATNQTIDRSFYLKTLEEKEHQGKISRLIAIHFQLKDRKKSLLEATYRLIVEKQTAKIAGLQDEKK